MGNLPLTLTSFVGRQREITEIKRMLSTSRLVTLTGPGGVGKTRLALKVAADLRRAFSDEVWLVELDQLRDPALLVSAVAESLGLREQSTRPLMATLAEHLARRRVLLVLDNCEHMVDAVAVLADTLLRWCPQLQVVATSRERLGAHGEVTLSVPSLSIPDLQRPCSLQELSRFEAVILFADRAAAKTSGFDITEDNQRAVAEICHRLDGLPLAIELAAVWLQALSAQEIAHRLNEPCQLLTRSARNAPTRQQTLRACIQWSYDLCSPQERLLWARLAVFDGSFQLDAAEGVCAGDDLAAGDILDVLASLIDKSILIPETHGAAMRYRMLESIRGFGREKMQQTGEYAALSRQLRGWYANLVARVNVALGTGIMAWRQGDPRRAAELLKQSLRLKQGMDDLLGAGWCLEALAWIAADEHEPQRAAVLLGAAKALSQDMGTSTAIFPDLLVFHEQCERQTRHALGEQAFQAAFRDGMGLSVDDAVGYALGEVQPKPSPADTQRTLAQLTRREHQVAELVAQGMSNKNIAAKLVISQRTAECHIEHILVKLGFTSRAQIAVWVAEAADGRPR